MRKLPKLYSIVKIKFSSLRIGIGENWGVVNDVDTDVIRKCRRVLKGHSWQWQVVCNKRDSYYDHINIKQDNVILAEYGADLEFEYI